MANTAKEIDEMYITQQVVQKKITGIVVDEQKSPLPGVTIQIAGKQGGVITDIDGKFSIDVSPTDKLVVSYIGMETKTVTVGDKKSINIELVPKTDELDEVTVVAFAKQKKESVLASVTTVKVGELKVPSSNLTTALAGRMAGLISYQLSGEPGKNNASFFIRGITTFSEEARDPLILIDGVELTADDLSRLNTDDIASFSLMKDATATALYGARGANGVILVTTKEGKEGKAKLSIRIENSFSSPTKNLKLADPITFMKLANEATLTRDPLGSAPYSSKDIAMRQDGANSYVYPTVDWMNMLFKDVTANQRINLNLSGGGKIARYYVAGSFTNDNGVLKVDKRNSYNNNINLKRYLLRSNVNINVTPTTEAIVRLHATFDDYSGPLDGGDALYQKVMQSTPVAFPAYYLPDETYRYAKHILYGNTATGDAVNPYADMTKGYKEYSTSLMMAQVELKQKLNFITKGLALRAMMNTSRYAYFETKRQMKPYYYQVATYDRLKDVYTLAPINTDGQEFLSFENGSKNINSTMYMEAALSYDRTFDKHGTSGLLVYQMRDYKNGNAESLQLSLPKRNLGLSGRFTYNYDLRYFAEFNFGYNGSERFSKDERFGFFPSGGLGWLVSNEPFWKGNLKKVISKLKLKATYGMVGNDQIGNDKDRFFYLSQIEPQNSSWQYSFGTENGYTVKGVKISRYADPYITWETAYKQNYGLELGLFEDLEIQVDYFRENRKNILQTRSDIPTTMGLTATPNANIGEAFGQGIDISLDYQHSFSKDWWLTARGTFTYASSEYKVFEEPAYNDTPWRRHINQKLSQQWGLIAERLFVSEEEIKNSPKQMFGDYQAGDIKYKDINKDGLIDDRDKVPIGYPTTPEINYGFGFSTGYKNIDFSIFFQGSAKSSFWLNDYSKITDQQSIAPFIQNNGGGQLLQIIANSHWSEDNRDLYAFWPRLSNTENKNNTQKSTWWMRDGSFIRLKSLEIGYSLPKNLLKKVRVSNLRIYLSGTNLLCFSKFKLWDPEMGAKGMGYPLQRVFNLGLNIDF
jgi:TonB-linked SusC/RagA family outer membrane protein